MSQSDPPPDSPVPAVRASDAEREAAVSQLRTAAGEGRLSSTSWPSVSNVRSPR